MKKLIITITTFLLLPNIFAQLAMKLELNQKAYIRYEKIKAVLTIKNQSGHPIVFGENKELNGKIKFEIETMDGEKLKSFSNSFYKIKDKLLKAGEQETFFIPLSEYFQFKEEENYKVKVIVSHARLEKEYESNEIEFAIVHSNVIWSTKVGVPTASKEDNTNKKIEDREYSILSYHDGENNLYCLMVQDKNYVYGLTRLGFNIGTRQPECMIDRLSRVHIILQASPDIYSYFVYDIGCKLEEKAVYKQMEGSIVKLFKDENTGRISVSGGIKASEGSDYIEENVSDTSRMK